MDGTKKAEAERDAALDDLALAKEGFERDQLVILDLEGQVEELKRQISFLSHPALYAAERILEPFLGSPDCPRCGLPVSKRNG